AGKDIGGTITVRAFTGFLKWTTGLGLVDKSGKDGVITLKACDTAGSSTNGTTFTGVPAAPVVVKDCTATAPTLPSYVVLPTCSCAFPGPVPCPEDPFRVVTWTVGPDAPSG